MNIIRREFTKGSMLTVGLVALGFTVGAMAFTSAYAQQYPIPTTAAEVPGPPSGTAMTKAYVQSVGRMAYLWGWPLVNVANRADAFSKAPSPACWAAWCRSHSTGMRC